MQKNKTKDLIEKIKEQLPAFFRFLIIGGVNTGLNFLIVNGLARITDTYKDEKILLFGTISFVIILPISYILNKHWSFKDGKSKNSVSKTSQFVIISVIGFILNNSITYFITTIIGRQWGISEKLWLFVAMIFATGISMLWNFIGYRFFVFKSKDGDKENN